jgi:hypothetical protein
MLVGDGAEMGGNGIGRVVGSGTGANVTAATSKLLGQMYYQLLLELVL